MARKIPLPRLTQRQRTARWQRERRQQAIIVTVFSAVLLFSLGLVAWAAADRYYADNLMPAAEYDGRVIPIREFKNEARYQYVRLLVEMGVPPGFENDPQLASQRVQVQGAALEYLLEQAALDGAARAAGVTVSQADIDARLHEDLSQYRTRHVLLTPDAAAADKDAADKAALAKAEDIARQLKAAPNDEELWKKLASEHSSDTGTKDGGGELGWTSKGQFVKEYEDAAKALAIGEVSGPVKSQFGYHVIQVEERRGAEASDLVKRLAPAGFGMDDVRRHARYDVLREEFTRRAQEAAVESPTQQVRIAKIVVATPTPAGVGSIEAFAESFRKISDVVTALDNGTDFAEVAKKHSEDSVTAEKGGEVGWIARGMLTDLQAEDQVFALETGKRTPQIPTGGVTTIYKVLERDNARALTDEQRAEIKQNAYRYWLEREKKEHGAKALLQTP